MILVAGLIATGVSLATFGHAVRVGAGAVGATLASWWNAGVLKDEADGDEEVEEEPVPKAKRVRVVQTPPEPLAEEEEPELAVAEPEPEADVKPARLPAVVGATPRAGGHLELPKITVFRPPSN